MSEFALSGNLWIGDGKAFAGHVVVAGGRIRAVKRERYRGRLPVVKCPGLSLSPGMIDLMVIGGFNKSLLRDDPLDLAREYVTLGVTACQFCTGTLPWKRMRQIADNVRCARADSGTAARLLGVYWEGPFQDPDLTGASLREHSLPPTAKHVRRLLTDVGDVTTMINVSPGTPGDATAVKLLRQAGKVVSMAHSNADAARVLACLQAGTTVLGHVWDNNSGRIGDSGVQQPTIEHVALVDERVRFIHLICDGTHVHPLMVQLVLRCRGVEPICLVTDACARAGCPDGKFRWDDGRLFYKKDGVGRTDKGWLCGSALLLPDHLRNFVKFTGLPPHEAIRTVTSNPARSLGLDRQMGLLAPGRHADLVAWDDKLRVRCVWRGGKEIRVNSDIQEVRL